MGAVLALLVGLILIVAEALTLLQYDSLNLDFAFIFGTWGIPTAAMSLMCATIFSKRPSSDKLSLLDRILKIYVVVSPLWWLVFDSFLSGGGSFAAFFIYMVVIGFPCLLAFYALYRTWGTNASRRGTAT